MTTKPADVPLDCDIIVQARIATRPVPKARVRVLRNGHAYTPDRVIVAEDELAWELKQARYWPKPAGADVAVGVRVAFHSTRRDGDLDNFVKLLLDSANGVLWADDRQVAEIYATVERAAAVDAIDVLVWAL